MSGAMKAIILILALAVAFFVVYLLCELAIYLMFYRNIPLKKYVKKHIFSQL